MAPIHEEAVRKAKLREDAVQHLNMAAQNDINARVADFEKASKDLSEMHVDPNAIWGGSEARRITGVIAQALGAFAAGQTGGPNHAMQTINNAIDRNIAAQRMNIGLKEKGVEGKQNLIKIARERLGDNEAAEEAVRAAYLDAVKRQVDQVANSMRTPAAKQAAAELNGLNLQQASKRQLDAAAYFADNVWKDYDRQLRQQALSLEASAKQGEGTQARALTSSEAESIMDSENAGNAFADLVNKYKEIGPAGFLQQAGNDNPAVRYNAAREAILGPLTKANNRGATSEKDVERTGEQLPGAGGRREKGLIKLRQQADQTISQLRTKRDVLLAAGKDVRAADQALARVESAFAKAFSGTPETYDVRAKDIEKRGISK
jgi:hypothetical protein